MNTEQEKEKISIAWIVVAMTVAIFAAIFFILLGVNYFFPIILLWIDGTFSQGLGLKNAAIIAAVVSVIIMLVFALAAGDGLLGEVQFMIPGFFLFFLFFWIMTAWVF